MTDITFTIIDPDAKEYEWRSKEDPSIYFGLSPEKMTESVGMLQGKFDVVIDKSEILVVFNYPLRESHIITLRPLYGAKNFTRVGLGKAISVKYQQIYEEEEKTTTLPVESVAERSARTIRKMPENTHEERERKRNTRPCMMMKRAKTDGKWGIYGHYLSDLDLHTVSYDVEANVYYLGIDSS